MAVLKVADMTLEIVYENDSAYVSAVGENYKGCKQIYCGCEGFEKFVNALSGLYKTLQKGKAVLKEFYEQDFISFESDGGGHFIISGELNDWGHWRLTFNEIADQTYLKNFIKSLCDNFN